MQSLFRSFTCHINSTCLIINIFLKYICRLGVGDLRTLGSAGSESSRVPAINGGQCVIANVARDNESRSHYWDIPLSTAHDPDIYV